MTKTQIVLATVGVAALAGGGTALAAKGHSHGKTLGVHAVAARDGRHGDDLEVAAAYLGTTSSDLVTQLQAGKTLAQIAGAKSSGLVDALVAHEKQELADAVTAGRLQQAQSDAIAQTLTQRVTDLVNGTRPSGRPGFGFAPGPGFAHPGGGPRDDLEVAAAYLGTTSSDLVTQLQAGKTLAQIAGAKSSGLVDALVAHEKQELADAVTAGRLQQAQSDAIAQTLTQRVTDLVNGTLPRRFGPPHGFGAPPHGFGAPPDGQPA